AHVEEMSDADVSHRNAAVSSGIKTKGDFNVLDCLLGTARVKIEKAAVIPTPSVTRVESHRTLSELERRVDVFAEPAEDLASEGEGDRVVRTVLQCFAGKAQSLQSVSRVVVGPVVVLDRSALALAAHCRHSDRPARHAQASPHKTF